MNSGIAKSAARYSCGAFFRLHWFSGAFWAALLWSGGALAQTGIISVDMYNASQAALGEGAGYQLEKQGDGWSGVDYVRGHDAFVDEGSGYFWIADFGTGGGVYVQEGALFGSDDHGSVLLIAETFHEGRVSGEGVLVFVRDGPSVADRTAEFWPDISLRDFQPEGGSDLEIERLKDRFPTFIVKLPEVQGPIVVWLAFRVDKTDWSSVHACFDAAKSGFLSHRDEARLEQDLSICEGGKKYPASRMFNRLDLLFDGQRFVKSTASRRPYPWAGQGSLKVLFGIE